MQEGSLVELIQRAAPWRTQIALFFVGLPIATFLIGLLLRRASRTACGRFLTVPIHLAVLPGVCMSLMTAYLLFFARSNLLADYDALLFFGPIFCMPAVLFAAGKVLPFDEIPGFDRLSGLMLTAAAAFLTLLILSRFAFRIYFFGSFWILAAVFLGLFLMFKIGAAKIMG